MKKSVKIMTLVVIVATVLSCFAGVLSACTSSDETLVVYNWEDYIDQTIIDDFAAYYKETYGKTIKVTYTTFDTNETMLTEIEKGGAEVDLICPSDYAIERLITKGYLQKIDKTDAMIANVNPLFSEKLNETFNNGLYDYMMPYMWGTLGILYNPTYVSEEQVKESGWGILWNSKKIDSLYGKVLMKDSVRDAFAAAVFYLKEIGKLPDECKELSAQQLINNTSDALVEAVKEVLVQQKQSGVLKGYEVDLGKTSLVNGSAYVDLAWSGDALYAIEEAAAQENNPVTLAYYAPTTGGNLWFDGWVIPKNAPNSVAAQRFLDYMSTPVAGVRNMLEIGYTSAISATAIQASEEAMALITEAEYDAVEFFADDGRYPDNVSTAHLGVMQDFAGKETEIVAMWEEVKANQDGDVLTVVLIVVGALVLAAVVLAVVVVISKKKKSRRRIKRVVRKTADTAPSAKASNVETVETTAEEQVVEQSDTEKE